MKKFLFLLLFAFTVALVAPDPPQTEPPQGYEMVCNADQDFQNPTQHFVVPEVTDIGNYSIYQASFLPDGFMENMDIIGIILLIFTTIFGALWITARSKLKEIGDLFLKAYEYTDDKKLSVEERLDLKERFLKIFTKTPS